MKPGRLFVAMILVTLAARSVLGGGGIPGVVSQTYSIKIGDYTWFYEIGNTGNINNTAHVLGVSPATGDIEIPAAITRNATEYPVTSIKDGAFYGCSNLTSVKIPDSINRIAQNAFSGCNVALFDTDSVPGARLVDGWLLGHDGTLTGELNLSGIRGIGDSVFANFAGLTSVTLSDTVTSIGDNAFYGCGNLTSVTMGDSVTSIGHWAFDGCCNLKSVTIMGDCPTVGWYAFDGVAADCVVYLPLGNETYNIVDGKWQGMTVEYWGGNLTIVDGMLTGCSLNGATKVIIPDSVTSIGNWAFFDCRGLTSVTIPNSVTSIGDFSFYGCSGLTSVTIPDSVTSIGREAFGGSLTEDCDNITSLIIGNSVTSIGDSAFSGCGGLTSVTIPQYVCTNRLSSVFPSAYQSITNIVIFDGVTSIGDWAFYECSGLTSVTIGSSVTNIGASAFSRCSKLKSVTIPDSVTSIGNNAFYGCSGLTSVTIPGRVTSIGVGAFYNCSGLTNVTIPDGVTNIGASAFSGCSGLTSVTIPDGVTSIANSVFYCCSGLTSVTIPDSVTEIGEQAFYGCSSLKTLSIPAGSVESYGADCFEGCPAYALQLYRSIFGSGATSGGGADAVTLTVTNVVVHYVTQSVSSDAVTPTEQTGLVNVIAEVSAGGPVAISSAWAEQYEGFVAKFGSDFTAALTKPTGKRDGAGNAMLVWQDYVAGTDPTKKEDVFTASITFDGDGKPVISYTPELSATEAAKRTYRTFGKVKLNDKDWIEIADGEEDNYNFFKVTVEMK